MTTKSRVVSCVLSAIVLIVYVCVGSLIFTAVENDNGNGNTNTKIEAIKKLMQNINILRNFSNTSTGRNFYDKEYIMLLNDAYNTTLELLVAENAEFLPWDFYTGIHFCITAITTIGYGYITPVTQLGRGLCILYVVIGIPINLVFSSKLAYFVTKGITKLYIVLTSFIHWLLCKYPRRKGDPDPTNVYRMNVMGEVSQGVDLQYFRERCGSMQYINDAFTSADEKLSPKSDEVILRGPNKAGLINGRDVLHSLSSIDGAENTNKETPHKTKVLDDKNTFIPVWFMFLLLVLFCSLSSIVVHIKENEKLTFLDSFYFVIITFTTIGFGDLPFKSSRDFTDNETIWYTMIYTYVLMEIGLVTMTTFITMWSERCSQRVKKAKASLHSKCTTTNAKENG